MTFDDSIILGEKFRPLLEKTIKGKPVSMILTVPMNREHVSELIFHLQHNISNFSILRNYEDFDVLFLLGNHRGVAVEDLDLVSFSEILPEINQLLRDVEG